MKKPEIDHFQQFFKVSIFCSINSTYLTKSAVKSTLAHDVSNALRGDTGSEMYPWKLDEYFFHAEAKWISFLRING